MDALLTKKADELARELAGSAATLDDLNGMMRSLMKTAIETMLNSEMSVHLGRGRAASAAEVELGEKALIETTSAGTRPLQGLACEVSQPAERVESEPSRKRQRPE